MATVRRVWQLRSGVAILAGLLAGVSRAGPANPGPLAQATKATVMVEWRTGPREADLHVRTGFCVDPAGTFLSMAPGGFNEADAKHAVRVLLSGPAGQKALPAKAWGTRGGYGPWRLLSVSGAGAIEAIGPSAQKWETNTAVTVLECQAGARPGMVTPPRAVPYTLVLAPAAGWKLQPTDAHEMAPMAGGAPILDADGGLLGIVTSPQYLSSLGSVQDYLSLQMVEFDPAPIPHTRRHEKREFSFRVHAFGYPRDRMVVELATGSLRKGMAVSAATHVAGTSYRASASPMDPALNENTSAPDFRITVKVDDKMVADLPGTFEIEGAPTVKPGAPANELPPITAPEIPDGNTLRLSLPSGVHEVFPAMRGRYLLCHLPATQHLAVLDVSAGKIVKFLSLPGRCVPVAGAEHLLLILPDEGRIEKWSLAEFIREQKAPIPRMLNVHAAAMGCSSTGPVMMVVSTRGPKPLWGYAFLDAGKLTEMTVPPPRGSEWKTPANGFSLRASPDGRIFTGWASASGGTARPCHILDLGDKPATAATVNDTYCLPSSDGDLLMGETTLYDEKGQALNRIVSGRFAPVQAAPMYMQIEPDKLTFYLASDRKPLVSARLALGGHIFYIPPANAVISAWGRGVTLHRFDLAAELEKAGGDFFFIDSLPPRTVRRGQAYAYQLSARSKGGAFRFSLENGPKGMTITDGGLVQWTAPALPGAPVAVTVAAVDAANRVVRQTFTVEVQ